MGTYVLRARAPKKGFATVTIKGVRPPYRDETVKAAVAEYAYKVTYARGGRE